MLIDFRAVHNAGGPGSMFHEPGTTDNLGWAFMFGITAILGAWGAGTLGQSDWTRYANRRFAPTLSQLVAAPITIAVTAIIGIIVTSASRDVLGGEVVWNPIYLLADIQEKYHSSSRSRAGVFFASLGLVSSQLAVSVITTVARSPAIVLTTTDLRRLELGVDWNGHGWPLAQVYQHYPRELYHGGNWHCHSTMATVEHSKQVPLRPQRLRRLHGASYVSGSL